MFLVVKPLPPAFVENPTPLHVRSNCSLSYPDNNFVPIDHVVVPTTEHQLPLGVLSYREVKTKALARTVYSSMPQPSNSKMAKQHDSTTTADVMVDVAVDDAVIAPKRTFVSFVIVFAGVLLLA